MTPNSEQDHNATPQMLTARLRREASHDAVEIPDMTKEESLSWEAADRIEQLEAESTQRLEALLAAQERVRELEEDIKRQSIGNRDE